MSKKKPAATPVLEDYQRALQSLGTLIDITANDLMELADRARLFAEQRATESISVTQVMTTSIHTVLPDTRLSEAAHLLVSERISGLPVVNEEKRLVGLITEADFLRGVGLPTHHPSHNLWHTLDSLFNHLGEVHEPKGLQSKVKDYMVRDVICCNPDQNIDKVLETMKNHRIKRVLICDKEQQIIGIITRSDLVRLFFDKYFKKEQAR